MTSRSCNVKRAVNSVTQSFSKLYRFCRVIIAKYERCLLSGSMLKSEYIKLLRAMNTHYLDTCVTMQVHEIIIH